MPNRRQAISWTNIDPVHWRIYAAPGGDGLTSWTWCGLSHQGNQPIDYSTAQRQIWRYNTGTWMTRKLLSLPSWWRHRMETFSALLAFCAWNSPVTGEFSAQRPVTRSFDVFCDLGLNKPLGKLSWVWQFETPSRSLWRHYDVWTESSIRHDWSHYLGGNLWLRLWC